MESMQKERKICTGGNKIKIAWRRKKKKKEKQCKKLDEGEEKLVIAN